jgi:hypothetical protein
MRRGSTIVGKGKVATSKRYCAPNRKTSKTDWKETFFLGASYATGSWIT